MNIPMEENINKINQLIKDTFQNATSINIFLNYEGIKVDVDYKTNNKNVPKLRVNYFMPNLDTQWIKEFK